MEINTTINIHVNGELYPLNTLIKEVNPVASQPSILDQVAKPSGKGFYTGDLFKSIKRTQVEGGAASKLGGASGFVGATSQEFHKVFVGKTEREDNIIIDEVDLAKLVEGKGGGQVVAREVANFIITGRETDLKDLLAKAHTEAAAVKLHTAFDNKGLPSTAQPATTGTTTANIIADIKAGRRINAIANLEESKTTRIDVLRAAIAYLNKLGGTKSAEKGYLYAINGFELSRIKVLTDYENAVSITDEVSQNYITVSTNTMRNITGIVGLIDNKVEVLLTNQMPATSAYAIMTDRVFVRDLDPTQQYIGKVRDAASVVLKGDTNATNLRPSQRLIQFQQARTQGVRYAEEIIFIDQA